MILIEQIRNYLEKGKKGDQNGDIIQKLLEESDVDKIRALQAEAKARIKVCNDLLSIIQVEVKNVKPEERKKRKETKQQKINRIEKEINNLRYASDTIQGNT